MARTLHVVNGDETAARLAPAALPGDVLVWRDILIEGPVDAEGDIDTLAERRAPWLARRFGIPADAYVANGRAQAAGLARTHAHDEVVLWFEEDLFCVANLAHVAAWLRRAQPAARVSLVFPAEPLGRMDAAALAARFTARGPFTDAARAEAAAWWAAYASSDPTAFTTRDPAHALPFLDVAARLHLARFPAVATGLGSVDAAALDALDEAPRAFADVFRAVATDARMRGHAMTDTQLTAHLGALTDGPAPLVRVADAEISLTPAGVAVRDGVRDRLDAQALDWWLGGVRLSGRRAQWRWNEEGSCLVAT